MKMFCSCSTSVDIKKDARSEDSSLVSVFVFDNGGLFLIIFLVIEGRSVEERFLMKKKG